MNKRSVAPGRASSSHYRDNNLNRETSALSLQSVTRIMDREVYGNSLFEDDNLAPVMPAIDVVQQLMDEENRNKSNLETTSRINKTNKAHTSFNRDQKASTSTDQSQSSSSTRDDSRSLDLRAGREKIEISRSGFSRKTSLVDEDDNYEDEDSCITRYSHFNKLMAPAKQINQEDYEFIPKSVILDVYSNDPEVKRFLKQLTRIANESGYNEQEYKCHACRRPIGMIFGQSRLCHYDGHQYCSECHLGEKSIIPARVLCNWDFNKYPISKRNQHFLTLISNEPMFELKTIAPLLYDRCPEMKEIGELRCQAFFIRSYCFTCANDSASFEVTKLVWPREHLIKQTDLYSLDDLIQIKSGSLKNLLKNVIVFGKQHVLSCVLCRLKGFICEICKSSRIIYPFETESVHRCDSCQGIYHKACFKVGFDTEACPRCRRLKERRSKGLQ